jgi:hypothetical protein
MEGSPSVTSGGLMAAAPVMSDPTQSAARRTDPSAPSLLSQAVIVATPP